MRKVKDVKGSKSSFVANTTYRFIAVLAAFALAFSLLGTASLTAASKAFAEEGASQVTPASGIWGTCPWELDENGTLTVHPGEGENTGLSPWQAQLANVKSIVFAEEGGKKVIAPEICFGLFEANYDFELDAYPQSGIKSIDLSGLDTSNVTVMSEMFTGCTSLTSLDLSSLNTSKVESTHRMFEFCSSLTSINFSGFNTSKVTDMIYMFEGCSSLVSIDLSGFNTSSVTSMSGMFEECSSLASLDLSGFNTSQVTDMSNMFYECSSLTSINLSSFNTSSVTNMGGRIEADSADKGMFEGCSSLTTLNLANFNTSNVNNMCSMFSGCNSLTSLDLSNFNTSRVANMGNMFYQCSLLTSLNLSNFDTSQVTDMSCMFSGCNSLGSVDLASFNTSKSTKMYSMFSGCSSLTTLDLSTFDTTAVDMSLLGGMASFFEGCDSLAKVKVGSKFDFKESFAGIEGWVLPSFPDGTWKSEATGRVYTSERIAEGRSCVADTYTKVTIKPPAIVNGADAEWVSGSEVGVTFTSDADFVDFVRVEIDGDEVEAANYGVQSGSTIVTLKSSYLKTLSVGKHEISIVSENGTATTNFTVQSTTKGNKPASGIVVVDEDSTGITVDSESKLEVAEGDEVKLEISPMSEDNKKHEAIAEKIYEKSQLVGVYDVSLLVNNVEKANGFGYITLVFPVDAKYNGRNARVWHIHEGEEPDFQYSVVANGKVHVTTSRLSVFGVEVLDPSDNPEDPNNPDTPDDSDNPVIGPSKTTIVTMYRLYNPNSGEHFYTADKNERDSLRKVGWLYEGVGWKAPSNGDPVYRLYNPNEGEHHYTTSAAERDMLVDAGWRYEDIGWYSDTAETVPLYRLYNPNEYANNHHYTKDAGERDYLMSLGWKYEDVAWYGL